MACSLYSRNHVGNKTEEKRRNMESSGEKIPIGPGKVSKRGAKSVLAELSSRGLESFLTHGYAQLSRWLLNIRNLSLCFSPPILDKVETRQKFPIFYSRGPSFPEAAHPCLNTDLSPPSINSLGKHVTRGRLHPDTGRKLPKVQRIPGDLGSTARIALFRS